MDSGTQRRMRIASFIARYTREHGYSPTVREIGAAVGLRSSASVQYQLDRMRAEGWLTEPSSNGRPRTVRVV